MLVAIAITTTIIFCPSPVSLQNRELRPRWMKQPPSGQMAVLSEEFEQEATCLNSFIILGTLSSSRNYALTARMICEGKGRGLIIA